MSWFLRTEEFSCQQNQLASAGKDSSLGEAKSGKLASEPTSPYMLEEKISSVSNYKRILTFLIY